MKTAHLQILAPALVGLLPVLFVLGCGPSGTEEAETPDGGAGTTPPPPPPPMTTGPLCPDPPPCGDDCSNDPYEPTDCWTTHYGPAEADIVVGDPLSSTNFLYCEGGSYALCFFSGPPYATGRENADNDPLPCELDGEVADCTCEVYTSGPYFVDIHAILNLGAYFETVTACGADGSGCANIANCGRDGTADGCAEQKTAPVCGYVRDQDPDDPSVSLIPGADLISAFSFAMDDDYQIGTTPCEAPHQAGLYAGCMTAPCSFAAGAEQPPSDGDPIQCRCPTWDGPFQVGQFRQDCSITSDDGKSYVWSAAYSVAGDDGDDDDG